MLPLIAVVAIALGFAGCGDDGRQSYATETDEPYYRQAEQMKRSNRQQEALSAYLKVIEKRGDDAPESHLEAGLIYLQHIRDPIAAIYHFRKYLSLRPNSAQAPLVKQRIDAAIRDFARTLPAQPLESQLQRVDLIAAMDKLKLENDLLKQQIADLQAGRTPSASAVAAETTEAAPERAVNPPASTPTPARESGPNNFALNLDSIPTVRTRPSPARQEPVAAPPSSLPATRTPTRPAQKQSPAAAPTQTTRGARTHTVTKGDTLMNLSQRYYGTRSRWRDIYQANRGAMKNEGDIRVGMQLTIPQ